MLARAYRSVTDPRGFWSFLAFYGLLLLALRLLLLPGASQDDAEQLLFAQTLAGGYNPAQPPLYTWLVVVAQSVVGVGPGAVVLVKYAALIAIYGFLYPTARLLLADRRLAALAALSPLALYYVAWDAVLNYSNTVLMSAASAATIYALVRVYRGGIGSFVGLGVALGVGLMAKYGFALFLAALFLAALSEARLRARLLRPGALLAVAVAFPILLPHLAWLVADGQDLGGALGARLDAGITGGYAAGVINALLKLANAIVVFLFPLIVILPIFFPKAFRRRREGSEDARLWMRFFERFFAAAILLIVVGILAFGVTTVRTHYMFVLLPVPIYVFLRVEAAGVPPQRARLYLAALLGLTLVSLTGLAIKGVADPRWCRKCYFHAPYEALAGKLREAGFRQGTILAHFQRYQMAGNFRRWFPDSRILSTKYPYFAPPLRDDGEVGQCLLIWERDAGAAPPGALLELAAKIGVSPADLPVRMAEAPMIRGPDRPFRIGYALLPAGVGDCR